MFYFENSIILLCCISSSESDFLYYVVLCFLCTAAPVRGTFRNTQRLRSANCIHSFVSENVLGPTFEAAELAEDTKVSIVPVCKLWCCCFFWPLGCVYLNTSSENLRCPWLQRLPENPAGLWETWKYLLLWLTCGNCAVSFAAEATNVRRINPRNPIEFHSTLNWQLLLDGLTNSNKPEPMQVCFFWNLVSDEVNFTSLAQQWLFLCTMLKNHLLPVHSSKISCFLSLD